MSDMELYGACPTCGAPRTTRRETEPDGVIERLVCSVDPTHDHDDFLLLGWGGQLYDSYTTPFDSIVLFPAPSQDVVPRTCGLCGVEVGPRYRNKQVVPTCDCWEARMSARARERYERELAREQADLEAYLDGPRWPADRAWMRAIMETPLTSGAEPPWRWDPWVWNMPLVDACTYIDGEGWACACHGPPNCCVNVGAQARLLRREAHLVARQLADLLARRMSDELK